MFANVDWNGAGGPGWRERAVAQLEAGVKNGAIGSKVFKNLGLSTRKADGSRLKVDDPDLDPVWQALRAAEHPGAHPHRRSGAVLRAGGHPQRTLAGAERCSRAGSIRRTGFQPFETADGGARPDVRAQSEDALHRRALRLVRQRFRPRRAACSTRCRTWYFEVGAVLYEFGRQPRAAREFFIKYQDRVLFGKDAYEPTEYPYYWRVFETRDEYFDYYRDYHAFWKLYGMDLPDAVLRKLDYQNALARDPRPAADRLPVSHVRPLDRTITFSTVADDSYSIDPYRSGCRCRSEQRAGRLRPDQGAHRRRRYP